MISDKYSFTFASSCIGKFVLDPNVSNDKKKNESKTKKNFRRSPVTLFPSSNPKFTIEKDSFPT